MINWILLVAGALLILLEVILGAITGFDFLLIGSALLLGGVLGMATHHPWLGVAAAGVLSVLYVLLGRSRIRNRLRRPGLPSNTDALLGQVVTVAEAATADQPGRIRHEGEEWRALVDAGAGAGSRIAAAGGKARITRVDGVTVYVVPLGPADTSAKEGM